VQQQRETLLSALSLAGSRATDILSAFQDRLQEANLPDLSVFAEAIESEIETVLGTFPFGAKAFKEIS